MERDLGVKIRDVYIPGFICEIVLKNPEGVKKDYLSKSVEKKYGKLGMEAKEVFERIVDDALDWKVLNFNGEFYTFDSELVKKVKEKFRSN